jgi:hypothetical protein
MELGGDVGVYAAVKCFASVEACHVRRSRVS